MGRMPRTSLINSSYMVLNLKQVFFYLPMCSGWSQVSPKKSTSSTHAVIFIEIAIYATSFFFTYVFRLVSSITKKFYKHKSCSNFYRDCHLCKKLFLHVFRLVSSITKKSTSSNHAALFIENTF